VNVDFRAYVLEASTGSFVPFKIVYRLSRKIFVNYARQAWQMPHFLLWGAKFSKLALIQVHDTAANEDLNEHREWKRNIVHYLYKQKPGGVREDSGWWEFELAVRAKQFSRGGLLTNRKPSSKLHAWRLCCKYRLMNFKQIELESRST
jgi:hypothetical protein